MWPFSIKNKEDFNSEVAKSTNDINSAYNKLREASKKREELLDSVLTFKKKKEG
jgi:flagellar biosynthesis chaperone FliJ